MTTDDDGGRTRPRASRGALTTLGGQWLRFGIQLTAIVVMARLLPPQDFGVLAMVTAIMAIATALGDFGLPTAVIQAATITRAQRSNLFWMNVAIGLALTGLMLAAAPWLGSAYGDSRVTEAARWVSVVFVLNATTAQFRAHLTRDMRFGILAMTDWAAQAAALIVGVVLAVNGFGWRSLAAQLIAVPAVTLLMLALADGWVPGLPRRAPMRALVAFGVQDTLNVLILLITSNVDTVLVAKFWGSGPAGLYQKAFQLVMLPLQQIFAPLTRVALPVLSRISEQEQFVDAVLKLQRMTSYLVSTLLAMLAICAYPLVSIGLGRPWLPMVPMFLALVAGGIFELLNYPYSWMCLSRARTDILLKGTLITRPVMIVLIVIGATLGPLETAIAVAIGFLFSWGFFTLWAVPACGIPALSMLRVVARPVLLVVVMASFAFPISWLHGAWDHPWAQLGASSVLAGLGAGVLYAVSSFFRGDVRLIIRELKIVRAQA